MFHFGKHKGTSIKKVAKQDPSYLQWILDSDFSENFKRKIRFALGKSEPTLKENPNRTQSLIQDFITGSISSKELLHLILD